MSTPIYPCLCVPSSGLVKARFATSLANLVGTFVGTPWQGYIKKGIKIIMMEGSMIADNREKLGHAMLAVPEATHALFLDDDMVFPGDLLFQLLQHDLPIVGCNYPFRTAHRGFTAGTLYGDPMVTSAKSTGLEPAAWVGFGAVLIHRRVFEIIDPPWFSPRWNPDHGGYGTEDVAFCAKAQAAGFSIYVDHDASKTVAHLGSYEYRWDDPIIQPAEIESPRDS